MKKSIILGLSTVGIAAVSWFVQRAREEAPVHSPIPMASREAPVESPSSPTTLAAHTTAQPAPIVLPAERTEAAEVVGAASAHDQLLANLEQQYSAEPENLAAQARNHSLFEGMFQRLNYAAGFASSNFQCRGSRCRGELSFGDRDQALAVLNQMRFDPAWDEARIEYQASNAAEEGAPPRYIAHFRTDASYQ
jgi:hypothetical protein